MQREVAIILEVHQFAQLTDADARAMLRRNTRRFTPLSP